MRSRTKVPAIDIAWANGDIGPRFVIPHVFQRPRGSTVRGHSEPLASQAFWLSWPFFPGGWDGLYERMDLWSESQWFFERKDITALAPRGALEY